MFHPIGRIVDSTQFNPTVQVNLLLSYFRFKCAFNTFHLWFTLAVIFSEYKKSFLMAI